MIYVIIYSVVSVIFTVIFSGIEIKEKYKEEGGVDTDDIVWCVLGGFWKGFLWIIAVPFAIISMLAMAVGAVLLKLEDKIK